MTNRQLIEDYLPIQAISAEALREKSVRKGHISTLHLWWDPLGDSPEMVCIHNPATKLDYEKSKIVAAGFIEVSSESFQHASIETGS